VQDVAVKVSGLSMSSSWQSGLPLDPFPALLADADPALVWFVKRDLQDSPTGPIQVLWDLPEPVQLASRQQANGAWPYTTRTNHPAAHANYDLLETYRSLRVLVEMYGLSSEHPCLAKAAEYVFSCQTAEGDIRGILGNQYMPYYHAGLVELLIKAGYAKDARIEKSLQWLLSMRQADGGWIIPVQQIPSSQRSARFWDGSALMPEGARPLSQLATGMVLRAFAAHPDYRQMPEIITAAERLKERFFLADQYNDRKAPSYWLKFQFPFWWPNLLTALDSLSRLGFSRQDDAITQGLDWFARHQSADGFWETSYPNGRHAARLRRWVGLAICRVLKRFFEVQEVFS
jgi:hypothetical protein